jgi:hypothetical protein
LVQRRWARCEGQYRAHRAKKQNSKVLEGQRRDHLQQAEDGAEAGRPLPALQLASMVDLEYVLERDDRGDEANDREAKLEEV